jgi:hypothetical protein
VISEPSVALFTVNGYQMDALVSVCSSKDKSSTGQKARRQAAPIERHPGGIFAPSLLQPRGNTEHLSKVLRELANTRICLPKIRFGTWNYSGDVEPLRAAIEYGTEEIEPKEL